MKSLYESLLAGKVSKPRAKVRPSSRYELAQIIDEHIKKIKPRPGQEVDLNWIDISEVDDLSSLFKGTNYIPVINTWKIDHVKTFKYMFKQNRAIKKSPLPVLQNELLTEWCYEYMFVDCDALVEPPVLPATKLTKGCYCEMFMDCTALKVTPALPAKTLVPYCYNSMFWGCTSLEEPPALPATKLAPNCYASMFRGCHSLKVTPELLAYNMF